MMSAVRSKDTKLELAFRRRLFALGFRCRLHRKSLPGTPDLVFPKYSAIIFIHGCYWHYHGCHLSGVPQTRRAWWQAKLQNNLERDRVNVEQLKRLGWRIMIIWECSFRKTGINREQMLNQLTIKASKFLLSNKRFYQIPQRTMAQLE